ncbi:MAG: tetracycline resistance MFS efflux pump [Acidobacteria bacterium]|nr:MAG: tetracycline resistance MFS efflux pump [Acidobacteria bacterium 13_1_40CM_4_58_4]PYT62706.1 MAG: tetracycline resistance MFS efflux pump [Acidobacteriota bacterium]
MAEKTTPAPLPSSSPSSAAFVFILVMVAFDFLAFGIIAPVLPDLIRQFEGGDFGRASDIVGYFGFAWNAMQFIFSPILGAWSDRFGRRPIILISCFGLGIDYIFMALAPSLGWLFVGRIISGITASNVSTAFAYITDVTPPEKRARPFGLVSAAFGLGFVIGPAVGGYLGNINLRFPFWAAAILSLTNTLYGFFILPESLPPERRAKSAWHMANPMGSLNLFRSHPQLAGLAVVTTLYYLAHQSLQTVYVLYTEYRYAWNQRDVGLSLAVVGVSAAIVSGVLVGPFVKRFGERHSLLSGLFFGTLGFVSFGLATRGWIMLAVIPFIALWGIAAPAMQSLMSQRVDPTSQGKLQGAINSLRAITGMAGPVLFGRVFALAISPRARIHLPGTPYYLAGLLLLSSLLLAVYVTRPGTETAEATGQPATSLGRSE